MEDGGEMMVALEDGRYAAAVDDMDVGDSKCGDDKNDNELDVVCKTDEDESDDERDFASR